MWPTTNGVRKLVGDEAHLIRVLVIHMVDQLVGETSKDMDQHVYGIEWFDSWDAPQRLWLLEQVTTAMLSGTDPPPPAAMLEATVDTIFAELFERIVTETDDPPALDTSWRQRAIDAFETQNGRPPKVDLNCVDQEIWGIVVSQIADSILGIRLYQQAESFRDRDFQTTLTFLNQKGLPANFLEQIPPLLSADQTKSVINRIASLVGNP